MKIETGFGTMVVGFRYTREAHQDVTTAVLKGNRIGLANEPLVMQASVIRHVKDQYNRTVARQAALTKLLDNASRTLPSVFNFGTRKLIWRAVWSQMRKPHQKRMPKATTV